MEFENVMSNDFWLTSGWHLTVRDNHGHMVPSADFMRAYFMREEVAPEGGLVMLKLRFIKNWLMIRLRR